MELTGGMPGLPDMTIKQRHCIPGHNLVKTRFLERYTWPDMNPYNFHRQLLGLVLLEMISSGNDTKLLVPRFKELVFADDASVL